MTTKSIELGTLISEFSAAKKIFRERAEVALKAAFQEFFTRFPEVEALAWPQYAPYFNDGEPCEFNVHEIREITVTGVEYDIYYGDQDIYESGLSKEAIDAVNELSSLVTHSALEDVMAATFGNDCKVIATAKGFTTDEYSHD